MSVFLIRELEKLKTMLLSLSGRVEEHVNLAVTAVLEHDAALARQVIEHDRHVDLQEIEVEEECLKILALHQPVAADLRYIVAVLKINTDLERVGDMAASIAESALALSHIEEATPPYDVGSLSQRVGAMLRKSLDAFINLDLAMAAEVCGSDDEVDEANRRMYDNVKEFIRRNPDNLDYPLHYLTICRRLERIADHATNIAEDVLYLGKGAIVRHPE